MEANQNDSSEFLELGATSFVGLMNELIDIKGYRAAAIMTYDGELLYSNSNGSVKSNLDVFVEVLNGFFAHTCNLTEKSGFLSCAEVSLRTGEEVLVIRCSGRDCLVGIRLFVLIEEQSNVAVLQRKLGKLLPRIMQCLTWEPDNLVPLYMKETALREKSNIYSQAEGPVTIN